MTLVVFFATLALPVYLFVIIPKGFFPQQDTGLITGVSEAAQDISFADMVKQQESSARSCRPTPTSPASPMAHRRQRPRRATTAACSSR